MTAGMENMPVNTTTVIVIVGVVILAAVIVVVLLLLGGDVSLKAAKAVDVITMESIVRFFKSPEMLKTLLKDKNLMAVAIKKEVIVGGEKKYHVMAAMFDKEKKEVVNIESALNLISAKMDDGLAAAFGGKDMIVLQ